ncbi:MAG: hypothetical protein HYY16_10870 [Planctomycetes bacterium]|nr:hypothetical protein [Planctomycetota bacterium]
MDRFTIGQAYHWRARLVDLNGQSAGWVDFGGNGAGQADFVSSFTIAGGSSGKCGALGADVLIPLALVWFWRRRRARVSTKAVSFRTANPASAARPGPGSG